MKYCDKDVLFLDNHILAVEKEAGLLTLPTDLCLDSVETRAKAYIKEKFHKPGAVFLHPAHRLDRPASGIVVCARTSKALSRLNEAIRNGEWEKRYIVWHEGKLPQKEGKLIHYLEKGDFRTKTSETSGKEAILYYKQLTQEIAEVHLVTGRYHQIRAQFAHIGCPIVGDTKYGAKTEFHKNQIGLHHTRLAFPHPVTKEQIVLTSNPPFLHH